MNANIYRPKLKIWYLGDCVGIYCIKEIISKQSKSARHCQISRRASQVNMRGYFFQSFPCFPPNSTGKHMRGYEVETGNLLRKEKAPVMDPGFTNSLPSCSKATYWWVPVTSQAVFDRVNRHPKKLTTATHMGTILWSSHFGMESKNFENFE